MGKQQYEQVKLNEQFKIINEEIKGLSNESKVIIETAVGKICNIEMNWGMLCAVEIGKYSDILNEEESINLIGIFEEMISPVYLKEMKKDLKFIKEGENK